MSGFAKMSPTLDNINQALYYIKQSDANILPPDQIMANYAIVDQIELSTQGTNMFNQMDSAMNDQCGVAFSAGAVNYLKNNNCMANAQMDMVNSAYSQFKVKPQTLQSYSPNRYTLSSPNSKTNTFDIIGYSVLAIAIIAGSCFAIYYWRNRRF